MPNDTPLPLYDTRMIKSIKLTWLSSPRFRDMLKMWTNRRFPLFKGHGFRLASLEHTIIKFSRQRIPNRTMLRQFQHCLVSAPHQAENHEIKTMYPNAAQV